MKTVQWVLALAVFTLLVSVFQLNLVETVSIDTVIQEAPDMPQISVENTGSDIWPEAPADSYISVVYLCEVSVFKLPQIDRINYKLIAFNVYTSCWYRRLNANKNNFIV